ncbi:hypothetical protein BH09PSE1_BH09PSE1_02730 [soil metagenome]
MEALPVVLSAEDCRERARQFFARAVAEDDLSQREAWLLQGERWMQRWRYWAPDVTHADCERQAYGR